MVINLKSDLRNLAVSFVSIQAWDSELHFQQDENNASPSPSSNRTPDQHLQSSSSFVRSATSTARSSAQWLPRFSSELQMSQAFDDYSRAPTRRRALEDVPATQGGVPAYSDYNLSSDDQYQDVTMHPADFGDFASQSWPYQVQEEQLPFDNVQLFQSSQIQSDTQFYAPVESRLTPCGSQSTQPPFEISPFQMTQVSPEMVPSDNQPPISYQSRQATYRPPLPTNTTSAITRSNQPPIVQGVALRAVSELAERFRCLFSFPYFNSVQSQCFDIALNSDANLVVSAPTGSGKTVIMELAMIRLFVAPNGDQAKVVYMAPTKALCNERCTDWQKKFRALGITCNELTGDTDYVAVNEIRRGNIIVTTPEKWDSISRRWHDHKALMGLLKLFLIDEVHMLNEPKRGATLEVVVSRMRTLGIGLQKMSGVDAVTQYQQIRLLALSATVPNVDDIGDWLKSADGSRAEIKTFGDEYRPVKLQKEVFGYASKGNAFSFEKSLDYKVMDVISKYSHSKATLIFCSTRKSAQACAEHMAKTCSSVVAQGFGVAHPFVKTKHQFENLRQLRNELKDKKLGDNMISGVAFHHAGMVFEDRQKIEQAFLAGTVTVICTTSTLAVGVNLPAYLVIIKGTQQYTSTGYQEYQGLDIMQMIGRAGRPQFEDSGVAVIMTDTSHKSKYDQMVSGTETIESSLHENLIEHLNAEIVLGTITNMDLAMEWLKSSFLYVRIRKNPTYYKLKNTTSVVARLSAEKRLEGIYSTDFELLRKHSIIKMEGDSNTIEATEYGKIMAKYYLKFNTTVGILQVTKAILKDALVCLSRAEEFSDTRYRGDKTELNAINKQIRFPIKGGKVREISDKVNILIQAVLGSISLENQKASGEFSQQINAIFNIAPRIGRGMIEMFMEKGDEISVRSAITLYQCINAKSWESSDGLVLKQVDGIGPQFARTLALKGILTIQRLLRVDPRQLEVALNRNPPFGNKILDAVKSLPQFNMVVTQLKNHQRSRQVDLQIKLDLMNKDTVKANYRTPLAAIFLISSADHFLIDHRRLLVSKIKDSISFVVTFNANQSTLRIKCSLLSEDYVGIDIHTEIILDVRGPFLPVKQTHPDSPTKKPINMAPIEPSDSVSDNYDIPFDEADLQVVDHVLKLNGYEAPLSPTDQPKGRDEEEFMDLDAEELQAFEAFEANNTIVTSIDQQQTQVEGESKAASAAPHPSSPLPPPQMLEDVREKLLQDGLAAGLESGYVPCVHKCDDKASCKHLCCKTGIPIKKAMKRKLKSRTNNFSSSQADVSSDGEDVSKVTKKQKHAANTATGAQAKPQSSRLLWKDDSDFESGGESGADEIMQPKSQLQRREMLSKRTIEEDDDDVDNKDVIVIDDDDNAHENKSIDSAPSPLEEAAKDAERGQAAPNPPTDRNILNSLHDKLSTVRVLSIRHNNHTSPLSDKASMENPSALSQTPPDLASAMARVAKPTCTSASSSTAGSLDRFKASLNQLNALHEKTVTNRLPKPANATNPTRRATNTENNASNSNGVNSTAAEALRREEPTTSEKSSTGISTDAEFRAACDDFLSFLNNLYVDHDGKVREKQKEHGIDEEFVKALEIVTFD
ncbi:hypothetical protein SeLEV6574_g00353 [Synchytrium endobioticum]|uniref:DNA 3'-5' helicase n=1 Tax=Synchytrium endobioticum TaxID=286115 RepID=A0A507DKE5_9FUNG|nr:hypothetical protein SeLEV6574_g00353 [Synchytrium endobioticum]